MKKQNANFGVLFFLSVSVSLLLADTKYLCSTSGASTLIGRATILHRDPPRVVHLNLLPTLHTVCLHSTLLLKFDKRLSRMSSVVDRFGV